MENSYKPFRKLIKSVAATCQNYKLIEPNDRILVAVSGGKDSLCLLSILNEIKKRIPFEFEFFAFTLDQGQPGFDAKKLEAHYSALNIEHYVEYQDTFSIVNEKLQENQTPCFLCSRLRRGILYSRARELKANKIALGHHADDAMETLLMNLFYTGRNASIPPKLVNDEGDITVIRPLIETDEIRMTEMAETLQLPVLPCTFCGSQENLQRQRMKKFLKTESENNPYMRSSLKNALRNVQPRYLWMKDE